MKNSLTYGQRAPVPRQPVDAGAIDAAREELVGLARVAREQPLQIAGLQVLRVDVEELACARCAVAGGSMDWQTPVDGGASR